jgi:4-amino-4-deoxy-L-arabinose transferase-like glycosyltransferase
MRLKGMQPSGPQAAALLCATALVFRLVGIGAGWLPPTPVLVLLLGLSQLADWFFRQGSRSDLGTLVRAHAFELGLATLAVITLAVRLPGLTSDLGHVPIDIDENRLAANIQHYFVTGELVHTTVEHYPGVAFWLFAGASFLRFVRGLGAGLVTTPAHLSVAEFVAAARLANVFVAVGIVTMTALIGRRIAGWWAGLLAGLLVAIAPLSVDTTTVCRCDPVMLVAVLAAVHLALLARDRKSPGWFVAAGAVAGIATGVKYSAVFAIVPVLVATLSLGSWRDALKAGTRAVMAFGAAIAITNHFVWYDFPNFLIQLTLQVAFTGAGHWAATSNPAGLYAMILGRFGTGQALTAAAVLFAIVTLATRRLSWWILVSFPLLYFGFMTSRPSQLPRWVYPMLPFVAIASSALIEMFVTFVRQFAERAPSRARAAWVSAAVLLAAALASPLYGSLVSFSRRLATPTHVLAEAWIREHARPGAVVVLGRGWLDVTGTPIEARRVDDLKKTLDGGLDALNGAQIVVVPEPYFNHPTLGQLGFLDRIHVGWRVGSGNGYDYEFYAVPQR